MSDTEKVDNSKKKGGGEQTLTVCLRIRPMSEDEENVGATKIAHAIEKNVLVLRDPMDDHEDILRVNRTREKKFVFDHTFDGDTGQEEVYVKSAKFLTENVINGYNATVFAYGATGAGKTYTMLGIDNNPGIMARALNDLFLEMDKTSEEMVYNVSMSYLEIYNEMIRDLLVPSAGILDLREDAKGGCHVAGLSEVKAKSTDDVMKMLIMGNKQRTQEPTAANKTSSRSHAVLQVTVIQKNKVVNTSEEVRTGKFFMVDLAGSERAANTHNKGKRMVEGAHINRSLLALGNCINALSDKQGAKYINYRDSKLTRLLKDALGGNCKTVMIAHVSPASTQFEESRNTLVYADRAKHIKTKVRRNVADVSYHIAQYSNIIQELREEIMRLRSKLHDKNGIQHHSSSANIQAVQAEVLESKRQSDREEMTKLKEQLLISFKDQMELRRSLMELNNASMEISLETNRNQLIISDKWTLTRYIWDVEKTKSGKNGDAKAIELSGAGSDDIPEPEDVKVAREELKVLHDEKHRTERVRNTVYKELDVAKQRTRKLEEMIPQRIDTEDQREILNLLCKVHQLEIEKTEVESVCILREFTIRKKDIIIHRLRQHQSLCDQIINKQRALLKENNIRISKELEELYDMYKIEQDDKLLQREDSRVQSPEMRFKSTFNLQRDAALDDDFGSRLHIPGDGSNRLFAMSAKSRRIREKSFTESIDNDQYMSYIPPSSPDGRRNSLTARSPLPSITLSNEDNYQIRITSPRPGSRTTSRAGSARPGSRGDRVSSSRPGSRTSRPASRLTSSRPGSRDRLSDGFSSPVLDEARATSPKITLTIDNGEDSDILVIQESKRITQTVVGDTDSLSSLKDDLTPRVEDRRVIQADTRQIHAVVKQKRSKQQNNLVNLEKKYGTIKENKTLYRPQKGEKEIFLDQNALARHNKNLRGDKALPPVGRKNDSDGPTMRKQNSQDSFSTKQTSVISDMTLPSMTDDTKPKGRKSEPVRRKRYEAGFTRSYSNGPSKGPTTLSTGNSENELHLEPSVIPIKSYQNMWVRKSKFQRGDGDYNNSPNNFTTIPEKDTVFITTPRKKTRAKRAVPSIPTYRKKNNFDVIGFSLPR
ncbi:hypothetical protein KUTeg_004120 [Tegillarca granosa]|uniref:Kinesin motor domain-containing protein n=1 Tax=Tegillarca granosa TaxID=220873 RepID=A0ABQ9FP26_TEGGR|nr:hypothetical protein KUTeg_004120 [Tegillarca granosa]